MCRIAHPAGQDPRPATGRRHAGHMPATCRPHAGHCIVGETRRSISAEAAQASGRQGCCTAAGIRVRPASDHESLRADAERWEEHVHVRREWDSLAWSCAATSTTSIVVHRSAMRQLVGVRRSRSPPTSSPTASTDLPPSCRSARVRTDCAATWRFTQPILGQPTLPSPDATSCGSPPSSGWIDGAKLPERLRWPASTRLSGSSSTAERRSSSHVETPLPTVAADGRRRLGSECALPAVGIAETSPAWC